MAETSYFWYGTVSGDATEAPYTNDEFSDAMRQAFQFDREHTLSTLFYPGSPMPFHVTIDSTSKTVSIAPGAAIIDGKLYQLLTYPKTFTLWFNGYHTLYLRKVFPGIENDVGTGQTVRAEMIWGGAAPLPPTQIDGEEWQVAIAYLYNDGTNITFYNTSASFWKASYDAYPTESVTGLRIFPETCLSVLARKGGSATNWGTGGDNNYSGKQCRIEVGSATVSANPQAVTFAESFPYTPVVIVTPHDSDGATWSGNNFCISALATTGFSVRFDDRTGLSYIHYMAMGPV